MNVYRVSVKIDIEDRDLADAIKTVSLAIQEANAKAIKDRKPQRMELQSVSGGELRRG